MSWRSVGPAGSFGSDEHMSFGGQGARRDDPTHNNALKLADMMNQSRGREIHIGPGNWAFCPPTPAAPGVGGSACIVPPSNTVLRGIPRRTVLQRYVYGMKDPTTNWEVYPGTATYPNWTANFVYGPSRSIIVNGRYYVTIAGGTSGATIPPALGTVFSGAVADNTVLWLYGDHIWRGPLIDVQHKTGVRLYGLTLDGIAGREDAAYPIATVVPPLMSGGYNDVTTGSGWDSTSQLLTGTGLVDDLEVDSCIIKRSRGENIYIGGGVTGRVHIHNCLISDGNADGISSTARVIFHHNDIFHVSQAVESFGSTFPEDYHHNWIDDCREGIILGNSAGGIVSPAPQAISHNRIKVYNTGIWWIGFNNQLASSCIIDHNTVIDAATGVLVQGFPLGDVHNVDVLYNHIECDTRNCATGMGMIGVNMIDISWVGNKMYRTPNAKTNGFTFALAVNHTTDGPDDARIHWYENTFIGRISPAGTYNWNGFHGRWLNNTYDPDHLFDISPVSAAGTDLVYPHNEHVYPYFGSGGSGLGIAATITNSVKFEEGQVVQVHENETTDLTPVLFPATGAEHVFPAPRITHPNLDFRVRLFAGKWVLDRYVLVAGTNAGKFPTANDVVPAFTSINAIATATGGVEFYGLLSSKVTPGAATNLDFVSRVPEDADFTIVHDGTVTFRHNTGATTPKFSMTGAVNYAPGAPGEVVFRKSAGSAFAAEIRRVLY